MHDKLAFRWLITDKFRFLVIVDDGGCGSVWVEVGECFGLLFVKLFSLELVLSNLLVPLVLVMDLLRVHQDPHFGHWRPFLALDSAFAVSK